MSKKSTLNNKELVAAVLRGDDIHHTLSRKAAIGWMYESAKERYSFMETEVNIKVGSSPDIKELILVRNCLVHNGGVSSSELSSHRPDLYDRPGRVIEISDEDIERFRLAVISRVLNIQEQFTAVRPKASRDKDTLTDTTI